MRTESIVQKTRPHKIKKQKCRERGVSYHFTSAKTMPSTKPAVEEGEEEQRGQHDQNAADELHGGLARRCIGERHRDGVLLGFFQNAMGCSTMFHASRKEAAKRTQGRFLFIGETT